MAFYCPGNTLKAYHYDVSSLITGDVQFLKMGWIRPSTDASYRRIWHLRVGTDSLQLAKMNTNKLVLALGLGNTSSLNKTTAVVTDGKWVHYIAYWEENSGTLKLWIDGEEITDTSNTTGLGTGSANDRLYLGARSSGDSPYKGDMAEVAAWMSNVDGDLPAPSNSLARTLYRTNNPWLHKPDELRLFNCFKKNNEPPLYLDTFGTRTTQGAEPTQSSEHAPITSDNFSFVSIVGSGGVDVLSAHDVSSLSVVSSSSVGQAHELLHRAVDSASEVLTVAVGQQHSLAVGAVESASGVSVPAVGQSFVLTGDGVVSASLTSAPDVLQSHLLGAVDAVSLSDISVASVAQHHEFFADDSAALSEVSVPTLTEGSHLLSADDMSSSVLVSVPSIGQVQVLMPLGAQSLSDIGEASLGSDVGLYADGVEAASVIAALGLGQEYALLVDGVSAASQVDAPDLQQWHVLLGDSVSVLSSIGLVALGDGSESVPTMEIQLRACRSVVARATTSVTVTH